MRISDLQNKSSIDSANNGSNLLLQLEQNVNRALSLGDSQNNNSLITPSNNDDNQTIKNYIAGISSQPLPGMIVQNTVV